MRDAYLAFAGGAAPDLWLMLGDNAYTSGTDAEYQVGVFDVYPALLRSQRAVADARQPRRHQRRLGDARADPTTTSSRCPRAGEAGGVASGTEAYYSFDYGNIHFVCLDSYETEPRAGRRHAAPGSPPTWRRDHADWIDRLLAPPALQQGLARLRHRDRAD